MKRLRNISVALLASFVFSSCLAAGAKDKCRTANDCFAGRICIDGQCLDEDFSFADGGFSICNDSCAFAQDESCDDGTPGSITSFCDRGTDCTDCSIRNLEEECFMTCVDDDDGCNEGLCMKKSNRIDGYRCSLQSPCPAGQQCRYGYCSAECEESLDCFPTYCVEDTVLFCAPDGDFSCSNTSPCEAGHFCVEEVCVAAQSNLACLLDADCGYWEQCLSVRGERRCVGPPLCNRSGECATGSKGSICNDGFVVTKGSICLQNHCLTNDECADNLECVRAGSVDVGRCSGHQTGEYCVENEDCLSGQCVLSQDAAAPFGRCQ